MNIKEKKDNLTWSKSMAIGNEMTSLVHNMFGVVVYVNSFLFAVIPFGKSVVTDVTLFVFPVN